MADTDKENPSVLSSDYEAMIADWCQISDIRAGARRIREKSTTYLPKYEKESEAGYKQRLASTPWRPEFTDALRNLCSKPFTKRVMVNGEAPDEIQGKADEKTKQRSGGLVDDIDGQGNNLHVFTRETFTNGVAMGLAAILVDYPTMAPGLTLADERASGARPYWVQIPAENIIALYTRVVGGRTLVEHIRIKECVIERVGFEEVRKDRVRVFELDEAGKPTWALWETVISTVNGKDVTAWTMTGSGQITLPEIPIALLFTGERSGNYRVKPPLIDLAVMQIELYRALSRKDEILTYAGSPMLKATGMNPPQPTKDEAGVDVPAPQITVGPKTVLFAPPAMEGVQPDWDFIQPAAANIKEVREDVECIIEDFRRLALQPTMPKTGTITATGSAIDAAKSHSAIEAWANGLTDTIDQALKFTAQWMNIPDNITVSIHTDFGVDVQGSEEAKVILDGNKSSVLSKKTVREEWQRRGLLGPNFDDEEEEQRLAEEQQGMEPEQPIDPLTGKPIQPIDPATGLPVEDLAGPTLQ